MSVTSCCAETHGTAAPPLLLRNPAPLHEEASPCPWLCQAMIAVGEGSDQLHREVHELSAEGDADRGKPGAASLARVLKDPTGAKVHDRTIDKVLDTVDGAYRKSKAEAEATAATALPVPVSGHSSRRRHGRRQDRDDRQRRNRHASVDKPVAPVLPKVHIPKVRIHVPTSRTVKQLRKLVRGNAPVNPKYAKFQKKFADKLKSKVCNFTFVCELFKAFAQPSLIMPFLCVSHGADCERYQNPEAHPEG